MIKFFVPHRQENEVIILLLRRHSFVIIIKLILWIFIALLPIPFYFILGGFLSNIIPAVLIAPLMYLVISLFYLFVWMFIFFAFIDYYLDVWLVTSERIINIEQKGLFNRTASEQKLFRIQDITSETKGIFGTFLNYGDVFIQTAGEQQRFIFKQVPHPEQVAKKINSLVEENKKRHHIVDGAVAPETKA